MSADSLFSPNWFRVAQLHPQLGGHVQVRRQPSRDVLWYLFTDTATGRQHRLNNIAYQFAGRCTGRHSTNEIWETLLEILGDDAPSQEEIIRLIGQLSESGMLQVEKLSDVETLFERHREQTSKQRRGALNPLLFRVNLFNPGNLLRRLDWFAQQVFRAWMLGPWALIIGLALIGALVHWSELRAHAATYLLTPRYLIVMWLCFPLIKAVHELAHGLAVRRWGGEVTQMGIALLVLVPAPYVDASAATAFRHTYQRVMVSAAGIMAELLIAALALFVWLNVETGLLRDVAFILAFIGSVSTLLFNGNPLLRFDGYYVLSDALNLPNLAPRSNRYWAYLAQHYLLKLPNAQSPAPARGERVWLLIYAPLSWLYKLFVGMLITFWVASKSFVLGLAAGLFVLYTTLAQPLNRVLRFAFFSPTLGTQRSRARLITAGVATFGVLAVGVMPMPSTTVAEGVVWLPERAQLRAADTGGFIVSLAARDGEIVKPGQLIAVLEDSRLEARRREAQGKLDGLRAEHFQTLVSDPLKARNADEAIQRVSAELARIEQRLSQLEIHAEIAGRLVMPRQDDLPGTFLKQGAMLGYVFSPEEVRVRAVVDEHDIALVRERTKAVEVLLTDGPGRRLDAGLTRETPAATQTLPSPALGDRAGGSRITDPADKDGVKTLEPVFLVDLTLPPDATDRVGGRAWVHFDHGMEPLSVRWARRVQQVFLKHFGVSD
ncbi:MAG TPA: biotin/lipoyl-binding protein [Rhodocyclaceae bacterium]|nr:biotin/lipoyl-binding protein [Rhodocyclaceae bacterium]